MNNKPTTEDKMLILAFIFLLIAAFLTGVTAGLAL